MITSIILSFALLIISNLIKDRDYKVVLTGIALGLSMAIILNRFLP